jgi:hypothetical protein
MNGFFSDKQINIPESFKQDAKKLSDVLIKNKRITRGLNIDKSASFLARAAAKHGSFKYRTIFDWLITNHHQKWMPIVGSAAQFFNKFSRLEKSMKRSLNSSSPKKQKDSISPSNIRDQTREVYKSLGLSWPDNINMDELLSFIQQSFDGYSNFRKKVKQLMDNNTTSFPLLEYIHNKEPSVIEFIRQWVIETNNFLWKYHRQASTSSAFDKVWISTMSSYKFRNTVIEWCNEFTKDQNKINNLIQELSNE